MEPDLPPKLASQHPFRTALHYNTDLQVLPHLKDTGLLQVHKLAPLPFLKRENKITALAVLSVLVDESNKHSDENYTRFSQKKISNDMNPYLDSRYLRKCQVPGCGKKFPTSARLSRHMISHFGTKRFKCPHPSCSRKYNRKDNMIQHAKTHSRE